MDNVGEAFAVNTSAKKPRIVFKLLVRRVFWVNIANQEIWKRKRLFGKTGGAGTGKNGEGTTLITW